jgi:hypothetical protein
MDNSTIAYFFTPKYDQAKAFAELTGSPIDDACGIVPFLIGPRMARVYIVVADVKDIPELSMLGALSGVYRCVPTDSVLWERFERFCEAYPNPGGKYTRAIGNTYYEPGAGITPYKVLDVYERM